MLCLANKSFFLSSMNEVSFCCALHLLSISLSDVSVMNNSNGEIKVMYFSDILIPSKQ